MADKLLQEDASTLLLETADNILLELEAVSVRIVLSAILSVYPAGQIELKHSKKIIL